MPGRRLGGRLAIREQPGARRGAHEANSVGADPWRSGAPAGGRRRAGHGRAGRSDGTGAADRDLQALCQQSVDTLVSRTRALTDAVKAGDLDKAKALYAPTRIHYERIEPIAELFSDLDGSIDSRADDHEKKEEDPGFTGFHRIEYGLYAKNSTEGLARSPTG